MQQQLVKKEDINWKGMRSGVGEILYAKKVKGKEGNIIISKIEEEN